MSIKISDIALVAICAALAYAGGLLFLFIPNVEIVTAAIFISGALLGPARGSLVGLVAQTLYSTVNPYGMSPPPLFVAQVLNRVLVGYVGGYFTELPVTHHGWKRHLYFGLTGLLLTWLYDLMTDFSLFFQAGFSLEQMKVTFTLGLGWYLLHGAGNTLIFAIVVPFIIKEMPRFTPGTEGPKHTGVETEDEI